MDTRIYVFIILIALDIAACATQSKDTTTARVPASNSSLDNWERKNGYYQLNDGSVAEPLEMTDYRERQPKDEVCPAGMVYVEGSMRQGNPKKGSVGRLQDLTCIDWMDPPDKFPRRCARFDEGKWRDLLAILPSKPMKPFCMDRYEYPNQRNVNPVIFIDWHSAKAICKKEGKRLCNEDEWTFACEGPDALPYPYGYVRSDNNCNIDKPWRAPNEKALGNPSKVKDEIARLWQGEPSGARPGCKSVFGVYDMTGNVDEWTQSTSSKGHPSIMKGGYWSVVRTRCRPDTRAHGPGHTFYQQGFRCCK